MTYCIRKHSVPSSGRKERTLPALLVRLSCQWISLLTFESVWFGGLRVQAVQRYAVVQRHDAVPAVAGVVGSGAEADAAEVGWEGGWEGGCEGGCCEKEEEVGGEGGLEGGHLCLLGWVLVEGLCFGDVVEVRMGAGLRQHGVKE